MRVFVSQSSPGRSFYCSLALTFCSSLEKNNSEQYNILSHED